MLRKFLLALVLTIGLTGLAYADSPTQEPFTLTYNGQSETVTLEDLGVNASQRSAFHNWTDMLFANIPALDRLMYRYNFAWNSSRSEKLVRDVFDLKKPSNARYLWDGEKVSITEHKDGPSFDVDDLLTEITDDYPKFKSYKLDTTDVNVITNIELGADKAQMTTLLTRGVQVQAIHETLTFPAQFKDINIVQDEDGVHLVLNTPYKEYVMDTLEELVYQEESNLVIKEANLQSYVTYATTEGRVQNGQKLTRAQTEEALVSQMKAGSAEVAAIVEVMDGQVINESGVDLGPLDYLATGLSNFKGSPYGRDYNVRKGLNDKYDSVLIPAGAEFSYNALLGPVTYGAGWKGSLAIFGGSNLRTVPGGGLCQVSTTMYRAALNAGMDITRKRNHSLYVHYYVEYGDGLDATIYPGSSDLKFVNNTGHPILIEAYADDYDAVINFYGNDDGRSVSLYGPYTTSNIPSAIVADRGGIGYNQILWKQEILYPDGRSEINYIVSTYGGNVKQY